MKKLTIKNMDGSMEEVDLINAFGIDEIDKDFVILSKGEKGGEGLSKIYISEVVEDEPGVFKMLGIETPEIWEKVKGAMKEIVNNNSQGEGNNE